MKTSAFYRFVKSEVERVSMLRGEDSWYTVSDAAGEPLCVCHVIGSGLGGVSTFHASREDPDVWFRLEPRRKVLNLTYFVCEGATGPRIATLELFASRGMKVADADGREIFRVVDPQGKLDKLMQDVLDGCCTEYALVDDDRVIGAFGRRARPEPAKPARRGLLGKLLSSVAKALLHDWCVELEDEGKVVEDHRPLLAGMILLREQSIRLDQSL